MKKIVSIIFALSIVGALCYQPYLAYATINDAISYWAFDESSGDAADSSSNSKTMTNTNTATFQAGKIANATHLTRASTQYFTRTNGAYYNGTSGTINCWVYMDTDPSPNVYSLVDHNTGGVGFPGVATRINASRKLEMYLGGQGVTAAGGTAISVTTWTMVTFTWNTSRKEVFLNGTSDGANETDETMAAGATSVNIGTRKPDNGEPFNGMIDECGWWNRVLSGAEITALYNAGAGKNPYAAAAATFNPWQMSDF